MGNDKKARDKARMIELDKALLEHMVATKQYAESWIDVERIRDKFLVNNEDRALYGLPPTDKIKKQVTRAGKKS